MGQSFRLIVSLLSTQLMSRETLIFSQSLSNQRGPSLIYEPVLTKNKFFYSQVIKTLEEFKKISDVIIDNRKWDGLIDLNAKIYTRDLFRIDN